MSSQGLMYQTKAINQFTNWFANKKMYVKYFQVWQSCFLLLYQQKIGKQITELFLSYVIILAEDFN